MDPPKWTPPFIAVHSVPILSSWKGGGEGGDRVRVMTPPQNGPPHCSPYSDVTPQKGPH